LDNDDDDQAAASSPAAEAPPQAPRPAASQGATATALYDYEAAEDNELSFPENAIISNVVRSPSLSVISLIYGHGLLIYLPPDLPRRGLVAW
jgi:hypothetical protein